MLNVNFFLLQLDDERQEMSDIKDCNHNNLLCWLTQSITGIIMSSQSILEILTNIWFVVIYTVFRYYTFILDQMYSSNLIF
jgi:hypothetical protein